MAILIDLHYLPSIPYFTVLSSAEKIIIEKNEHFEKQSYRNRCHILTSQGVERLIVPLTSRSGKVLITEVRLDYSQKWLNNHWRAIESAYRSSPFFEYYADDLHTILFKKNVFLYDLNFELLTICLKWLKW
ncbi:MAG TPA: WbqC family protein, partial [Cyclobacteriaceae bacterium]|nr:WbqC family protein [Cyclobacteriaceae bacterium]